MTAIAWAGQPAAPENQGDLPPAGLVITKALVGKTDVTKALAAKVRRIARSMAIPQALPD